MMTPIVELEGVKRRYPGPPPVEAVRDATFTIRSGDYVAVVGPSGSGKSTLLNIIGCLDRPSSGRYRFAGHDVGQLPDRELAGLRGRNIGFVFQAFHLIPHRTAEENVEVGLLYNRTPRARRRNLARAALQRVGLGHRIGFLPLHLSGGEQQRVAIARAIAAQPSLLICDEPTGNLDSRTSESILELFDNLRSDGLTIVVATHDPAVTAHAERVVEVTDGVCAATP